MTAEAPAHRELRPPSGRAVVVVVIVALALILWLMVMAWVFGVRAFYVSSPSMGAAAPVGSLVITQHAGSPERGQLISFHPPGSGRVDTHRVVHVDDTGGISTKGDLNGTADPWTLHSADLVGTVIAVVPAGGYALRVIGFTAIAVLLGLLSSPRRDSRVLGRARVVVCGAVGAAVGIAIVRPFGGFVLLEASTASTRTTMSVVSTSVLTELVHGPGTTTAVMGYGHPGTLTAAAHPAGITLTSQLAPTIGEWVLALAVCLTPLVWALIAARAYARENAHALAPVAV